MVQRVKATASIFIAVAIISSFCGFTSSATSSDSPITSVSSIKMVGYISLNDCKLLANNFILSQISSNNDKELTWDNSTKINEIIPLYDLDENINAYIFNLTTNGNKTVFYK